MTANTANAEALIKEHVKTDSIRITIEQDPFWTQGSTARQHIKLTNGFDQIPSFKTSKRHENTKKDLGSSEIHSPQATRVRGQGVSKANDAGSASAFYRDILFDADPTASVLPSDSLSKLLTKFKADLADNLTNENQLAKKFGFSRRRTYDVADVQRRIKDGTDKDITPEVVEYIAKLLKRNITLTTDKFERIDFIVDDEAPIYVYDKSNMSNPPQTYPSQQALSAALISKIKERIIPLSRKSLAELKDAAKFLGVYKSNANKDALIALITPLISANEAANSTNGF